MKLNQALKMLSVALLLALAVNTVSAQRPKAATGPAGIGIIKMAIKRAARRRSEL